MGNGREGYDLRRKVIRILFTSLSHFKSGNAAETKILWCASGWPSPRLTPIRCAVQSQAGSRSVRDLDSDVVVVVVVVVMTSP